MKTAKTKYMVLQTFGILSLITPTAIAFGVNWNEYFATTKDAINVSAGAMGGLAILVFTALGKADFLKGYPGLVIGLAICYLLNSILQDLFLIYSMVVLGDTVYTFGFKPQIKKCKEIMNIQNTTYYQEEAKKEYEKIKEEQDKKTNKKGRA